MSDDKPKITVTRGKRKERSNRRKTSSATSRSSSGLGLPGPGDVVAGMVRGVRNAWWAGLGVFSAARDAGRQVFDALVAEGKSWEQARRARAEETARHVRQMADESDALRAVEDRVRDEVNDVLQRVGAPSRDDVDALRTHVETLAERIDSLRAEIEAMEGEEEE